MGVAVAAFVCCVYAGVISFVDGYLVLCCRCWSTWLWEVFFELQVCSAPGDAGADDDDFHRY